MKEEQDYLQDIAEIRSMMERTSKFMSLSGWAGIMAGIYALAGVFIAWILFEFHPGSYSAGQIQGISYMNVFILAILVLLLAFGTAIFDAKRKARVRGEKVWNPTSRKLLINMAIPLVAGGILIVILLSQGFVGIILPLSLVFYGLALYNAGRFTYREVRILGYAELILGLASSYFIEYAIIFWAAGFGVAHIVYGIYMQTRYKQ